MPSSKWETKQWYPQNFAKLLEKQFFTPVILGTKGDKASLELERLLKEKKIPYESGVGKWSLRESITVLHQAKAFIGNDTGLFHIAEALGVPALVILGPTQVDSGFGPWSPKSKATGLDLWCRPCGKNGKQCHRIFERQKCLKDLSVEKVTEDLNSILQ